MADFGVREWTVNAAVKPELLAFENGFLIFAHKRIVIPAMKGKELLIANLVELKILCGNLFLSQIQHIMISKIVGHSEMLAQGF